jgi:hypothetical protein
MNIKVQVTNDQGKNKRKEELKNDEFHGNR